MKLMHRFKSIRGFTSGVAAAALTVESITGPSEERKHPHAEETEYSEPHPVGHGAFVWQSTASSHITPLTFSIVSPVQRPPFRGRSVPWAPRPTFSTSSRSIG